MSLHIIDKPSFAINCERSIMTKVARGTNCVVLGCMSRKRKKEENGDTIGRGDNEGSEDEESSIKRIFQTIFHWQVLRNQFILSLVPGF